MCFPLSLFWKVAVLQSVCIGTPYSMLCTVWWTAQDIMLCIEGAVLTIKLYKGYEMMMLNTMLLWFFKNIPIYKTKFEVFIIF